MHPVGQVFYASGMRGPEVRADGKGGALRKGYYFRSERGLHGPFRSIKIAGDAQAASASDRAKERWRHKERGKVYEVLTDSASLQCSAARSFEEMFEDDDWTVYRSIDTGSVYVRPTPEFLDGRFERLQDEE